MRPLETVAVIGNGSWAPMAHTILQKTLEEDAKGWRFVAPPLLIRSAMTAQQLPELEDMAEKLAATARAN